MRARIAVVMAVHDGASHLAEAVDSVLAQDGIEFEFLVIDDGSTDATAAILAGYDDPRLTVLRNPANVGLTPSLNRGLREARAPLVARMDADDVCLPGRLQAQAQLLESGAAAICFGRCRIFGETGEREWREAGVGLRRWRALFENAYGPHPAAAFRGEIILALGGYDESFARAQDYELWDRCAAAGLAFAYVPRPVLRYRSHAGAITRIVGGEQAACARRVSRRAMTRAFPALDDSAQDGLRWLMTGADAPNSAAITAGLEALVPAAAAFGNVWEDVSARLARRLPDLDAGQKRTARGCLAQAALRGHSPRGLLRLLRQGWSR